MLRPGSQKIDVEEIAQSKTNLSVSELLKSNGIKTVNTLNDLTQNSALSDEFSVSEFDVFAQYKMYCSIKEYYGQAINPQNSGSTCLDSEESYYNNGVVRIYKNDELDNAKTCLVYSKDNLEYFASYLTNEYSKVISIISNEIPYDIILSAMPDIVIAEYAEDDFDGLMNAVRLLGYEEKKNLIYNTDSYDDTMNYTLALEKYQFTTSVAKYIVSAPMYL